jgi:hypothetical protein
MQSCGDGMWIIAASLVQSFRDLVSETQDER